MWSIISERLKKVQSLNKRNNSVGDADALVAWDRDITEEKSTVCIDWRVITGSSNNIGIKAEVDTLFFNKSVETLQNSWRQIIQWAWSTVNGGVNLHKS